MTYILDTDILTFLTHLRAPENPRIRRRIAELATSEEVVTTIVNYEEQMRGWMAALARAKTTVAEVSNYARLMQHVVFYSTMPLFDYDDSAAEICDRLRKQRITIGAMDLKIASIALARQAVLITRNFADFRQVPGLKIEDWSVE